MRSVSVLLFICLLLSCSDKPKEEPIDKGLIGKYLYMSKTGLLHSKKVVLLYREKKTEEDMMLMVLNLSIQH